MAGRAASGPNTGSKPMTWSTVDFTTRSTSASTTREDSRAIILAGEGVVDQLPERFPPSRSRGRALNSGDTILNSEKYGYGLTKWVASWTPIFGHNQGNTWSLLYLGDCMINSLTLRAASSGFKPAISTVACARL